LAEQAAFISSQLASARTADYFSSEIEAFAGQPEEIWLRILDHEIRRVAGSDKFLRLERLETLVTLLRAAWLAKVPFAATLGGAKIRLNPSEDGKTRVWVLKVSRETPRWKPKPAAKPAS
jgi:hypothetical protein